MLACDVPKCKDFFFFFWYCIEAKCKDLDIIISFSVTRVEKLWNY